LEFNEPTSIVAVPEFNKLIVHCELALFSYSLELAIRVSQEDASSKPGLDKSEEKLAQENGNVLFFKAGRIADRTLSKQLNHIRTRFPVTYPQNSCLCIEGFQGSYTTYIRVDPPGAGPTDPSGSRIIIPVIGFGSSPRVL
jgi:hypothetical protein